MKQNDDILITPMTAEYIDDVYRISKLSFPVAWSKESLANEISKNKHAVYVIAIKDNMVLGYGGMWIIVDECHITNIAVHPEFRRIGIGNAIMLHLKEICRQRYVNFMTLEVRDSNVAAQNMYKKNGFFKVGVRKKYYTDNDEDALIMNCNLI